jgi:hypothetical protein
MVCAWTASEILTRRISVRYLTFFTLVYVVSLSGKEGVMPLLIRKYKLASGLAQEERIDDPDRIDRYLRMFEKDDLKKLNTGVKVFIEKDEWQLLP